jgi:GntR family transcriptional regulator
MRQRVAAREWEPGQALPSVAELADHYGASRTAVSRALKALESDGLVRIVPRWGTFRA